MRSERDFNVRKNSLSLYIKSPISSEKRKNMTDKRIEKDKVNDNTELLNSVIIFLSFCAHESAISGRSSFAKAPINTEGKHMTGIASPFTVPMTDNALCLLIPLF